MTHEANFCSYIRVRYELLICIWGCFPFSGFLDIGLHVNTIYYPFPGGAVARSVERCTLTSTNRVRVPATRLPLSVDIPGCQRYVHLIPCICGTGRKSSPILEMKVRVSVYLIIIISNRFYIAINELMGRKTIFNQYNQYYQFSYHLRLCKDEERVLSIIRIILHLPSQHRCDM